MIVSGSVTMLSPIETASQASPHCLALPGRMNQFSAGTHFIQVASAHKQAAKARAGEVARPTASASAAG